MRKLLVVLAVVVGVALAMPAHAQVTGGTNFFPNTSANYFDKYGLICSSTGGGCVESYNTQTGQALVYDYNVGAFTGALTARLIVEATTAGLCDALPFPFDIMCDLLG